MNERKQALLEAALMCSQYADSQCKYTVRRKVAMELSARIAALAGTTLHHYPPGKPVIDQGQVSDK